MNRASLDRGFGRCIVIKKSQAVLRKYANRTQDRVVAPVPGGHLQSAICAYGNFFRHSMYNSSLRWVPCRRIARLASKLLTENGLCCRLFAPLMCQPRSAC
jgi:hypothetical protein